MSQVRKAAVGIALILVVVVPATLLMIKALIENRPAPTPTATAQIVVVTKVVTQEVQVVMVATPTPPLPFVGTTGEVNSPEVITSFAGAIIPDAVLVTSTGANRLDAGSLICGDGNIVATIGNGESLLTEGKTIGLDFQAAAQAQIGTYQCQQIITLHSATGDEKVAINMIVNILGPTLTASPQGMRVAISRSCGEQWGFKVESQDFIFTDDFVWIAVEHEGIKTLYLGTGVSKDQHDLPFSFYEDLVDVRTGTKVVSEAGLYTVYVYNTTYDGREEPTNEELSMLQPILVRDIDMPCAPIH